MSEALDPDAQGYATFNDFFTRELRAGVRPIALADLVCPVDGVISETGPIRGQHILQAKGHNYTVSALLGGSTSMASAFDGGSFATLNLSPRDYHRIHMPCDGRLKAMLHIPGALFSVNPLSARAVLDLFARNERVVCLFEGSREPWVLVLVGATIVGSIATAWHGTVTPPRTDRVREWRYEDKTIVLRRGEEMGRFLLGSTVVLLFPESLRFAQRWQSGAPVHFGDAMADYGEHSGPTSPQHIS